MKNFFSIFIIGSALALFSCNNSGDTETTGQSTDTQSITPEEVVANDEPIIQIDSSNIKETPEAITTAPVNDGKGDKSVALNPPHGQPGHRCEIAVGAPLNSAPTAAPAGATVLPTAKQGSTTQPMEIQTEPATTEPPPSEPNSIMTAPASTSPKVASSTAPGMNPPHGQPGHDCNVAVGSPLKK